MEKRKTQDKNQITQWGWSTVMKWQGNYQVEGDLISYNMPDTFMPRAKSGDPQNFQFSTIQLDLTDLLQLTSLVYERDWFTITS